MKIIHINATNHGGSTGRLCHDLVEYANSIGHEAYIAYAVGRYNKEDIKIGGKFDRKVHAFLSRATGFQGYFSIKATRKLLRSISLIDPDIIHLHNLHSNYININMLFDYMKQTSRIVIITLHDCWFYTGKCTHYTRANCYRWKTGCGNCPQLKKDIPSWYFDNTNIMIRDKSNNYRKLNNLFVVGVSNWITNESRLSILRNAKSISTISNWVDPSVFCTRESGQIKKLLGFDGLFIIMCVSSVWNESKGIDTIVELSKHLDQNTKIVLVGNISNRYILNDRITHIEQISEQKELSDYYAMSDVFLNLSVEESFGLVSAEAISCGTPVIALDTTANSEIVGVGCGHLLASSNIELILKMIEQVKINGKDMYKIACKTHSEKHFGKIQNLDKYLQLYNQAVKDKSC